MPLYIGDGYNSGIGASSASLTSSGDWKASARVATTENITLSGLQTIDGIALSQDDRVLVKNQTTASQNGIYNASSAGWTRTSDASDSSQVTSGMSLNIEEGTVNGGTSWKLTTINPITIDTTGLVFSPFGGGATPVGSNGDIQIKGAGSNLAYESTVGYGFNYSITNHSLTIGPAGTDLANNPLSVNGTVNSYLQSNVQNTSNGTSASSDVVATADNGNDSTNYVNLGINSSTYDDNTFTIVGANAGYLYSSGGNMSVGTASPNTDLLFFTTGTLAANECARITSAGNFIIGRAAKATSDTNGFLYLSSAPGVPTGVPTSFSGRTPIAIDSNNGDLYLYTNNTWTNVGNPSTIGRSAPFAWLPQTGTTLTLWGMGATTAGTVSHPALATTNYLTQMRRARFTSATTAGSFAGIRGPEALVWRGNTAGHGGFYFVCRFAMTTNLANARAFVGLYASTAALTNADPSSLVNVVGMSLDSADANWQIISNDQTGTAPKVDLGANFAKSTTAVYEVRFWAAPKDTLINYNVLRLDTPASVTGTLSSDIPQSTVFLTPYIWITNNATASAAQIEMSRLYLAALK
jgi:hypothetical protein